MSTSGCSSPLSSPPLSIASRTPSPPADYPSPPSSGSSEHGNASKSRSSHDGPGCDDLPPAKRQRISKTRELKTEYLDVSRLNDSDDGSHHASQDAKIRRLMETLRTKRRIVVIAGAGISVSAGIPDFRSSTGLFSTLKSQHGLKSSGKHLFDAAVYRNDKSTSSFHAMVRELSHSTQKAEPTPFHHMLATLAEEGRLMRLYTQNVDGIDTAIPPLATQVPLNPKGPWPKTVQLHGGLSKMVCSKCGHLEDFNGELFEGPEAPLCTECETMDCVRAAGGLRSHGIGRLRPRMVLYNEYNPDEDAIGAVSHADLKRVPDAVLVVGTSLKIPGTRRLTKELCSVTRARRGGFTAWINLDPEPIGVEFKDCWDMVIRAECDDIARMASIPHWNDKDCGDYIIGGPVSPGFIASRPQVILNAAAAIKSQGMMTPLDSPRQQSPVSALAKLKQMPLSFAPKPAVAAKQKKKRGRKPLPSKTVPAGNRISNAFTATKTAKLAAMKKPKVNDENDVPHTYYSGTAKDYEPSSQSTDAYKLEETPPRSSQVSVEIPFSRLETVSPKGRIPNGMANLLN